MSVRIERKRPSMTQHSATQALRRIERELGAIILASPAWTGTLPPVQEELRSCIRNIRMLYNIKDSHQ